MNLMEGLDVHAINVMVTRILKDEIVKVYLYKKGFKPNYWILIDHGEDMWDVNINVGDNCVSSSSTDLHMSEMDQFKVTKELTNNAL